MRRVEFLLLLALVATFAFWMRPEAPPPETGRPKPDFDVMLMPVGPVDESLLNRMLQALDGRRGVIGLPYISLESLEPGGSVDGRMTIASIETQAQNLGATKIGVTELPLHELEWSTWEIRTRIAYASEHAALISTHEMPSEEKLLQLLHRIMAKEPVPDSWDKL